VNAFEKLGELIPELYEEMERLDCGQVITTGRDPGESPRFVVITANGEEEVRNILAAVEALEKTYQPETLNGVQLIAAERTRQVADEGWSPEHDDKHALGELGMAAESYLAAVTTPDEEGDENGKARPAWDWPWDKNWWKPSPDPIRNLVKAGALIAAEIDRLQRAKAKGGQS